LPDKVAELQSLIDAHWANAREPLYPYTVESPIMVDKTAADTVRGWGRICLLAELTVQCFHIPGDTEADVI
jgi:hypothetical protein